MASKWSLEVEEGDLVYLAGIAGSPAMSVQSITVDRRFATCMWFDPEGKLMEQDFLLETLVKAPDSEGS